MAETPLPAAPAVAYVAAAFRDPLPPPARVSGPIRWVRDHLFGSLAQVLLTLFGIWLVYATIPPLVKFFIIDAAWTGSNRDVCLPDKVGHAVGACWPFVVAKFDQLMYGFYPPAERWRVNLTYVIGAVLFIPLLIQSLPYKRLNAIAFFGVFPVVAFVLLTGGNLELRGFLLGWLGFDGLFSPFAQVAGLKASFWADYVLSSALIIAFVFALCRWIAGAEAGRSAAHSALFWLIILAVVLFAVDINVGLPNVETRLWGGLLVTLVIAVTGITVSLPFGILLALGRRSDLPLVKWSSILFIEFWRGVPLITVLFFATYMLPLFLPGRLTIDGLLRAVVGVALFAAAYMAEVVRGGLQAIPKGQYEGAMAVGLRSGLMMRLVVLPQALKLVIPGIVNNFIGLFKDTTLVLIVSIFDLLGSMRAAFTDPNWATPTTLFTGFGFAGLIYFIFCFGMSRYSMALEKRLDRGRHH